MCGFAVMLACDGGVADGSAVRRMTRALRHRGPDDEQVHVSGAVGLGFRRLSILDLSPAGHQPMTSADGQRTVVFNGEIYNYVELRDELRALGHAFRSTGDTEVLLRAYEQWGPDCLSRFNGMWAFVIHDRARQRLFGARDRFGVKPLYLHRTARHVLLASEIKAIAASGCYERATNWVVAARYLADGRLDEDEQTFHAGIVQVPPGAAFEIDPRGTLRQWRFWSLGALPSVDARDPIAAVSERFSDAVRLRMRSDVPVGVCLSGGLDSTSILCTAAALPGGERLQAFSYMSPDFDESRFVADTLGRTGAQLNRLELDPRVLWEQLPGALWHYDEPVHSPTALVGYELMRLASRRGVKVVLNGQGADETFAGYHSYFPSYWQTLLAEGHPARCWREVQAYARAHGASAPTLFADAVARYGRALARRLAGARAAGGRTPATARQSWFVPEVALGADARPRAGDGSLPAALRHSVETRPLPTYLRVEDRNSMAHSVEARLPFLDYRLVTLAFSLPPSLRMRGPWNKFALREAMRGRIPESVRTRADKMGFPTSAAEWFRQSWYAPMQDLLASRATRERGIYRIDVVRRDLERHARGTVNVADRLFAVAQFELWAAAPGGAGERLPAAV